MLHAIFSCGAALGDEPFFIAALPLMFWELDFSVGRRVMLVWGLQQYVGQLAKECLQLPRPRRGKVVAQLESHYAVEYGWPSTHAANAVSMPWLLVYLAYVANVPHATLGVVAAIACTWTVSCSLSRFYMGVHTSADVRAGLLLGLVFLAAGITFGADVDAELVSSRWTRTLAPLLMAGMVAVYPRPKRPVWVSSPGDTATILGAAFGSLVGQNILAAYAPAVYAGGARLQGVASAFPMPHALWDAATLHSGTAAGAVRSVAFTIRIVVGFCALLLTRAVVSAASKAAITAIVPASTISREALDELNNATGTEVYVADSKCEPSSVAGAGNSTASRVSIGSMGGDSDLLSYKPTQSAFSAVMRGSTAASRLRRRGAASEPPLPSQRPGADTEADHIDLAYDDDAPSVTRQSLQQTARPVLARVTSGMTADEGSEDAGYTPQSSPYALSEQLQSSASSVSIGAPEGANEAKDTASDQVPFPPAKNYAVLLPVKSLTYFAVGVNATFTVPLLRYALVEWWKARHA